MRGKLAAVLAIATLIISGCGDEMEAVEPVALDKLPPGSMEAAAKALPDVKFDRARKAKYEGKDAFEIIGKDKRGKVREVEVSTTGAVLDVE